MTNAEKLMDRLKGPTVILAGDCPDCGRMEVYRNCCGKCGGSSWLPAGYVNRFVLKRLMEGIST